MRQVSLCFSQLLVVFFCPPVANKCCRWFKLESIKLASTFFSFKQPPTFSYSNFNSARAAHSGVLLLPCLSTFSSPCSITSQTNLRLTWAQVTPVHPFLRSSVAAVFVLQSAERFQPRWAEPRTGEFTAIYGAPLTGGRLGLNSAAVEPRQRENSSSERKPVLWEIL